MGNRNVLVVLAVVFVLVLAWNALYFTGVVGDFAGETSVAPLVPDDRFDQPNFRGNVGSPQPVPSGAPRGAPGPTAQPVTGQRATVTSADLAINANWGRNPFLTPREIWAIDNYEVALIAPENPIPAGGLHLSAVLGDSGGRRMAVINNDVVGIGDVVAGMEIIDVWDDAVVFRLGSDRHVLRMNDAAVRLTVRGDGEGGQ